MPVLWACEQTRYYIGGRDFEVRVDHESLQYLMRSKTPGRLTRWALRLQEFLPYMKICYRPGVENEEADGLSRRPPCPLDDGAVAELCACDVSQATEFHRSLHDAGWLSRCLLSL